MNVSCSAGIIPCFTELGIGVQTAVLGYYLQSLEQQNPGFAGGWFADLDRPVSGGSIPVKARRTGGGLFATVRSHSTGGDYGRVVSAFRI
jgi:hypothetical protein